MRLEERLDLIAKRETNRHRAYLGLWANDEWGRLGYLVRRNRGFFLRASARVASLAVESLVFAIYAGQGVARSASISALIYAALSLAFEIFTTDIRASLIENSRGERRYQASLFCAFAVLTCVAAAAAPWSNGVFVPFVAVLALGRSTQALIRLATFAKWGELQIRLRIFVSPTVGWSGVCARILAWLAAVYSSASAIQTIAAVAVTSAVWRIAEEIYTLSCVRRRAQIERLLRKRRTSGPMLERQANPNQILARIALMAVQHLAPWVAAIFAAPELPRGQIAFAIALQTGLFIIGARALRAPIVDFIQWGVRPPWRVRLAHLREAAARGAFLIWAIFAILVGGSLVATGLLTPDLVAMALASSLVGLGLESLMQQPLTPRLRRLVYLAVGCRIGLWIAGAAWIRSMPLPTDALVLRFGLVVLDLIVAAVIGLRLRSQIAEAVTSSLAPRSARHVYLVKIAAPSFRRQAGASTTLLRLNRALTFGGRWYLIDRQTLWLETTADLELASLRASLWKLIPAEFVGIEKISSVARRVAIGDDEESSHTAELDAIPYMLDRHGRWANRGEFLRADDEKIVAYAELTLAETGALWERVDRQNRESGHNLTVVAVRGRVSAVFVGSTPPPAAVVRRHLRAFFTIAVCVCALSLGATSAYAGHLRCSTERAHPALSFVDDRLVEWPLADLDFRLAPLASGELACHTWLMSLSNENWYSRMSRSLVVAPLYTADGDRLARLDGTWAATVRAACDESPLCRVPSPFALSLKSLKVMIDAPLTSKETAIDERLCRESSSVATRTRPTAGFEEIVETDASEIATWASPQSSLTDAIAAGLRRAPRNRPSTYVVSTMTVSNRALETIAKLVSENEHITLFLLFDLRAVVRSDDLGRLRQWGSERLHLVPVIAYPAMPLNHHIKGFASDQGDVTLGALNLANTAASSKIDLGVSLRSQKLGQSVLRDFLGLANVACSSQRYLSCTTGLLQSGGEAARVDAVALLDAACPLVQTALNRLAGTPRSPVIYSGDTDLRRSLISAIESATRSVVVFAHQMGDTEFEAALARTRSRGVRVDIWIGSNEAVSGKLVSHHRGRQKIFEPHAKGLLIDDRELWLGTANFTRSGFDESAEYFVRSRNQVMIRGARRYLRSMRSFIEPILARTISDSPLTEPRQSERALVYLPFGAWRLTTEYTSARDAVEAASGLPGDLAWAKRPYAECLNRRDPGFIYSWEELGACVERAEQFELTRKDY